MKFRHHFLSMDSARSGSGKALLLAVFWLPFAGPVFAEEAKEAPTEEGGHRDYTTLITEEPAIKDELSFPTASYLSQAAEEGSGPVHEWIVSAEFQKRITERLGVGVEYGFTVQHTVHDKTRTGFENLVIFAKYQAYENEDHEFLLSLGVVREFGRTGTRHTGADEYGSTTPTLYFGKGLGDLPIPWARPLAITGSFGFTVADKQLTSSQVTGPVTGETSQVFNTGNSNRWVGGLSVQYSMPYLKQQAPNLQLPDFLMRLTPLVEVAWSSPASSPSNFGTQLLIAPGVIYKGDGFELGVEALIPANRATGKGLGVIAQINIPFDELFPNTLGKPVVDWFQ
jgi:hypothetical protein